MTRILSLFVMFMLFGVLAFAQNRVVTGKVLDDKGEPVVGASVKVVGSNAGTATDAEGNYRLSNVEPNATLRVTSLGTVTRDVPVTIAGPVNMTVVRTAGSELQTVTVATTALGIKRQPKELGYAQTTITARTLTQGKSTDVAQALNGKVSGVSVASINSGVFSDTKINIRGIRSLTGNNSPMLIVDGAPTPLGYLSSIAPEDIQSVTLLKSAASAAVYGPDAVNGVIVVTTKRGTGDKLSVSFSSAIQFTKVAFFPKLQHKFGAGAGEVINPDGSYGYVPYENQIYGPAFDGSIKDIGVRLEDGSIQSGPYSNLHASDKKNFYNTGYTLQNTLSISGKDFFVSVDDAVIRGVVPDDQNRRTSFRFNGGKEYNKLTVNYGLNYVLSNYNVFDETGQQNYPGTSYSGGLFFQILQVPDNVPLLQYKDWKNDKFAQYSNYFNEFAINPYWLIGNHRQIGRNDEFIGNVDVSYKLSSWLKATAKVSGRVLTASDQFNTAPVVVTDWAHANRSQTTYSNQNGSVFVDQSNTTRVNFDGFFSGDKNIGKNLNVKYLAGGMIRQNRYRDVAAGGNNLSVPYLYNVSVRSGDANLGGANFNRIVNSSLYSAYGTLGFGYKGFAFVEFTGRNDWDSRLLKENRSFFYPAVNASFVLSDAISGLKNNSVISFAKIRGAYSKSGNVNVPVYALNATYSQTGGFPYGSNVGFSAGQTIPSTNLTPEFVYTTEAGIELGFLKNRINFEASYFHQDCRDQVLTISQPFSTGYSAALANAARFKNYGVELDLALSPVVNIGKARIDLRLNATYNNSEVLETFQNLPVTIGGSNGFIQNSASSPTINNQAIVGMPAFVFQLTDYARDPASGKVIVDAVTGLPSPAADLVVKGRTLPLWVIGATPSVTLGGFTMSMTWDYKGGHNAYSGLGSDMDFSGISARSAEYNRQNFVFPNSVYFNGTKYVDNTNILTQDGNYAFWTGANTNNSIATNYFYSAQAIRLRELNLSYTLPASVLANSKFVKRLTFGIVGRNLFLFVPKSNQWGDPEFNYSAANNTFGVSSSFQAPSTRMLGFNLTAQF